MAAAEAEQGAGADCGAGGSGGEETQTETMHKRNLPRELCQEDLSLSLLRRYELRCLPDAPGIIYSTVPLLHPKNNARRARA